MIARKMRNAVLLFLVMAVGVLSFVVWSHEIALKQQQWQLKDVTAKLEAKSKAANLELQEKCAKQASELFSSEGWAKEQMAGFENHYNEKLNRCFIMVENTDAKTTPGRISNSKFLSDAFERKILANYFWMSDTTKKYREVPPFQCDVTLPSGEKKICHSSDEFDQLVREYLQ
jgi:hypothetical protein